MQNKTKRPSYNAVGTLQLRLLDLHDFENINESVYQVVKYDVLPSPSLLLVEAALVNDSHLLDNGRLSAVASAYRQST